MLLLLPFMVFFTLASWSLPVGFDVKKVSVDGQVITRSTPIIEGIIVEGADSIDDGYNPSPFYTHFKKPKATFKLSAAEAMEIALKVHGSSTLKDPYIERTEQFYEPIWLMHFDELRPAFKVRLPTNTIFDLKDIYVDAEVGDILKIEDSAMFLVAPAEVFVYSPSSVPPNRRELKSVMLKNLSRVVDNGFLEGEYVSVRTCCKYFTCPEEGECNDKTRRCAFKSHTNSQQLHERIDLPTDTLGLDPLVRLPPILDVNAIRCSNLPFARASYKGNSKILGFFAEPIDGPEPEAETDKFSEIQAYYSIMSFFENIRSLLNDKTFCLRKKEAMSCNPDGSPVLDQNGQPKNPYQVFVNQLIPDMKLEGQRQTDPDNFLVQILAGKGGKGNPVNVDTLARIGNAAFVPALSTLRKNAPRADEILSDLIKPYDHNVFFQGARDFAYDGDVVFHEFMHAVTTSLIGKLNSLGLDRWGINTEPGSLNEAWSDYFSAAFTGHATVGEYASVKGGFGESGLRNIDNQASCPDDTIGEIHNDGLIWSGSLWEIRSLIKLAFGQAKAIEFDRAVLASLAQATTSESFKTQSKKLLDTIKARGLGDQISSIAEAVFNRRGVTDCFRANILSTVDEKNRLSFRTKDMLFVASKNQIGLKNYAPGTSQLEVAIPAGATSLTISWRQYLGASGAMLGTEISPEATKNTIPLSGMVSFDRPITWKFIKATSVPTKDGKKFEQKPLNSSYENGNWQLTIPVELERCQQRTAYISLLSNDFKYALQNIKVSFDFDDAIDRSDCIFSGAQRPRDKILLSCGTTSPLESFLALLTLLFLKLRARKNPA